MENRRQWVLKTFSDAIANFLYYDRKDDGMMNEIELSIITKEVTVDELMEILKNEIESSVKYVRRERGIGE